MTRHVFIAESDYGNSGMLMALALQTAGNPVRCLVGRPHVYEYPMQGEVWRSKSQWMLALPPLLSWADWVTVIQSEVPRRIGGNYPVPRGNPERFQYITQMKRVALTHGGSYYRKAHKTFQSAWAGKPLLNLCYSADLMFGYRNEHLVVPPFNSRLIERKFNAHHGPMVVGHFPSRPQDKGTKDIHPLMLRLRDETGFDYRFRNTRIGDKDRVNWSQHIARMQECDVIIDQIAPIVENKPLGEWCSNATEAAALGCVTITNSRNPEPYAETYGEPPGLLVTNTLEELETQIRRLAKLSRPRLNDERQKTQDWAWRNHALEPTGQILARLYAVAERQEAA